MEGHEGTQEANESPRRSQSPRSLPKPKKAHKKQTEAQVDAQEGICRLLVLPSWTSANFDLCRPRKAKKATKILADIKEGRTRSKHMPSWALLCFLGPPSWTREVYMRLLRLDIACLLCLVQTSCPAFLAFYKLLGCLTWPSCPAFFGR